MRTCTNLAMADVISLRKRLDEEHHSAASTQLTSRVSAVLKLGGTGGDDVFAKVKGLFRLLRPMTIYPGNWRMRMSRADMEECLAKTQARIDKGDASVAKPSELVATLSEKVAGNDAAVADAAAMREKENA